MSINSLSPIIILPDATQVITSVGLTLMLSQSKGGMARGLRRLDSETGTGERGEQL